MSEEEMVVDRYDENVDSDLDGNAETDVAT